MSLSLLRVPALHAAMTLAPAPAASFALAPERAFPLAIASTLPLAFAFTQALAFALGVQIGFHRAGMISGGLAAMRFMREGVFIKRGD